MLDLYLAFAHHLLAFSLLGFLVAELALLRVPVGERALATLGRADIGFGVVAALMVVVGFCRAIYAEKGWLYYSHNMAFWTKIGVFVLIGLISIVPTRRFIVWRRRQRKDASQVPDPFEIRATRHIIIVELPLFALLPLLAAAMARGYWELAG